MALPPRLPVAARAARSLSLPVLGLLHLAAFHGLRSGGMRDLATGFAASALLTAGILLFRDFATSRRESRLPDVLAQAAWGAAALLELHALSPPVAASRIVPAVLFPAFSFLFPPLPAAACSIVSFASLALSTSGEIALNGTNALLAAMAGMGLAAGRLARGAVVERTLPLLPPGENGPARPEAPSGPPEGGGGRRAREEELWEGIQRVLEGILPVSGADRAMFVPASRSEGGALVVRQVAPRERGEERHGEQTIPDAYAPLREAMIFRRAFFAEGEESARWGLVRAGKRERPSGTAAVPVFCDGKEEGAILAFRYGEGKWSEPVVPVLEMGAFFIGREIAEAGRRLRMERVLEARDGFERLARTIADAAERIPGGAAVSGSPRRDFYRTAALEIRSRLGADRVLLIEAQEGRMRGRIVWEAEGKTADGPRGEDDWTGLSGTYAEWVLNNDVHRAFSGVGTSPGRHPVLPGKWARQDEEAHLLVPMAGAGGFRGLLVCSSREDRRYDKEDAEAAKDILALMRMGISHALHIETLEKEATTDGLTGLLNQKTFRERLSSVLSRLDGRYECAVIMVDIDHFKRVNDTYGHPAGDEVLKKVSNILRKTIRKADMAGRYGGEEFVLYLHQADREKAVQVAERIRLIVGKTRFEFGGREIGVTASLGVATYPSDGRESREILKRADEALYRSKSEGRNRTSVCRERAPA